MSAQVKDLNAAKAKIPYKTVAEVEERIRYDQSMSPPPSFSRPVKVPGETG